MINWLTEYINLIKPYVSSELIDAEGWCDIEAIAHLLPSEITRFFGFECRLGNPCAKADFLLCIGEKEIGQKILASESALPKCLLEEPTWNQIRNFVTCWQKEKSPLHQHVNNIWLEFDIDGKSNQCSIPSCFFGSKIMNDVSCAVSSPYTWVNESAIRLLRGNPLKSAVEEQLFRCIKALPREAYIFQIGIMLARNTDFVRICVRGISPEQIINYLQEISWAGSTDALKILLQDLSSYTEQIDLDLDVSETGVAVKIGLECYLTLQPSFEPRWFAFLDYLVNMGLCLHEKREALLKYPGYIREKKHQEHWPKHLLKLSQFLGQNYETVFMRGLHHIKVVYQSERAIEAKAYCWVTHSLLQPSAPT